MKTEDIVTEIEQSLHYIEFVERYKKICNAHNENNFDLLLKRIEKKDVLKFLIENGYVATYNTISKDFIIRNEVECFKFQLNFNLKHGIFTIYLGVYKNDNFVPFNESNFSFIYRFLIGDMNARITSPTFCSFKEFEKIALDILEIYEDFKREFLLRCSCTK